MYSRNWKCIVHEYVLIIHNTFQCIAVLEKDGRKYLQSKEQILCTHDTCNCTSVQGRHMQLEGGWRGGYGWLPYTQDWLSISRLTFIPLFHVFIFIFSMFYQHKMTSIIINFVVRSSIDKFKHKAIKLFEGSFFYHILSCACVTWYQQRKKVPTNF